MKLLTENIFSITLSPCRKTCFTIVNLNFLRNLHYENIETDCTCFRRYLQPCRLRQRGGGGDDLPNVNSTPNVNQNNNQGDNQSNPSNPTTPSKPAASAQGGNAYDTTGLSALTNSATKTSISGDKDSVITIGKHKITLVRPGITGGKFIDITDQNGKIKVSGSNLSHVRFGTATVFTPSGVGGEYEFAYGKLTPANDVPASGTATYEGYTHTYPAISLNASLFNVDFGKKTIDGKIYDASDVQDYVALSGTISGNSFSGTKGAVEMQGNFYGPNAAELGGIFKGQTDYGRNDGNYIGIVGSFGAKKQ